LEENECNDRSISNTLTISICFHAGKGGSEIVTPKITQEQRIMGKGVYKKASGKHHFVV
jgi:hypothetical protein